VDITSSRGFLTAGFGLTGFKASSFVIKVTFRSFVPLLHVSSYSHVHLHQFIYLFSRVYGFLDIILCI
jgi:hypothetical protein